MSVEKQNSENRSDSQFKVEFQQLVSEVFNVPIEQVCTTEKYADVIVKIGEDKINEWYYFELKTRNASKSSPPFGAVYMSQWAKTIQVKHYYFVLVEKTKDDYRYCLVSKERLQNYVTSANAFTYIGISKKVEKKIYEESSVFKEQLKNVQRGKYTDVLPERKPTPKGEDGIRFIQHILNCPILRKSVPD